MLPQKTIGKRIPRPERTTEEIRDFLNLVISLSKGKTHIRKGIYRFKSFKENNKWSITGKYKSPLKTFSKTINTNNERKH